MSRRRHRARRVPKRPVHRFYVLLAGITVLIVGAGCFFFGCPAEQPLHSLWSSLNARSPRQAAEEESSRLIYPYSVVAGGVHNPQELREAIDTDPVAAAHYAGFKLAKGRVIKLQHDRYAYVSFRVGDNIYWTSHKLRLRKGETLLTDGEHFIRTRCGNRLSKDARLPIYLHEPSDDVLNTPLPIDPESEAYAVAELAPISFLPGVLPQSGLLPAAAGRAPEQATYTPAAYTPFLPFFAEPGCTQKNSSGNHCDTLRDSPPPPPPAPTPENNAWILFASGMGILWAHRILRGKRGALEA